jgi:hypothetical protein
MKNLMKSFLVIWMILLISNIQAQPKIGLTAGLNLSTMAFKSMGISLDPKMLAGFNVGAISEFSLKGNLYLQPAILFSTKGSKFSALEEEMSISPSYIDVPVNAVYKFGSGSTIFFLEAGPYFAFGIGGNVDYGGESADIVYGSDESSDMKAFDYGFNIGGGVEINRLVISAHYGLGLANLAPVTTDDTKMKNNVIGLSISYFLGGK